MPRIIKQAAVWALSLLLVPPRSIVAQSQQQSSRDTALAMASPGRGAVLPHGQPSTVAPTSAPTMAIPPVDTVNERDSARTASLPARLATITTDTGDFAPGHRQFARYTIPGLCRAAAYTTRAVLQRTLEVITLREFEGKLDDTVGARGAAAMARACGARFTVEDTSGHDPEELFMLELESMKDTLAAAVLARRVALAETPAARDSLRLAAIDDYLEAAPARVAAAETVVAQLDADGRAALVARLRARGKLLNFWRGEHDPARIRQEAEGIIALWPVAAGNETTVQAAGGLVVDAYFALMELAAAHPDSMPMVAQRAKRDLEKLKPNKENQEELRRKGVQERALRDGEWYRTANLEAVIKDLAPNRGGNGDTIQVKMPRLQAAYWFPLGTSRDTIRPVQGQVNVIIFTFGERRPALADLVRRWLAQYGAQGLVVTFVVAVDGSVTGRGWTPVEQAEFSRWYVQEYEHLPVTVAVEVIPSQFRPPPDGRRTIWIGDVSRGYPFGGWAAAGFFGKIYVIDKKGRSIYNTLDLATGGFLGEFSGTEKERMGEVETAIEEALVQPAVHPAAASPPQGARSSARSSPLSQHGVK